MTIIEQNSSPAPPSREGFDKHAAPRALPPRLSWALAAVVTLAMALGPAMLWPADVSWMNDEPGLLSQAYHYNQLHMLARRGLSGSFPIPYGPFPTQVYQLLLLLTHDLPLIVLIRATLYAAITALSLLWMARTLRLTPWFAAAVVLAPILWFSGRVLWDASFAVPIAALALAAYALFLQSGSGRSLILAVAAAILVPLIHLQGLPLFGAIIGHLLLRRRQALRRHWLGIALMVGAILAFNGLYIWDTTIEISRNFLSLLRVGPTSKVPVINALLGSFMGGRLLEGSLFATATSHLRGPAWLIETAKTVSGMILPLIWAGIGLCAWRVYKARGSRSIDMRDQPLNTATATLDEVIGIALAGLAMQILMFGVLRVPGSRYYFFGTFPFHVLFAWIAIDALKRVRLRAVAIAAWGTSLAIITVGSMLQVHRTGWANSPSLSNQIEVAQALNHYSDTMVMNSIPLYREYPHAIQALRLIYPPDPAQRTSTSRHGLLIRYQPAFRGRDNRIELVEIHSLADVPTGATSLKVTPLPRWY
jgi:hypothetical protein